MKLLSLDSDFGWVRYAQWVTGSALALTLANAAWQAVPTRRLSTPDAVSSVPTDAVVSVLVRADGHVIVTPVVGQAVTLLDANLRLVKVLVDSTTLTRGRVVPPGFVTALSKGDSLLVGDPYGGGFLLLDPKGGRVRAVASPSSRDAAIMGTPTVSLAIDPLGRLVYRGTFLLTGRPKVNPDGSSTFPTFPDSFPIVRADFDQRKVDTVAVVQMPTGTRRRQMTIPGRGVQMTNFIQPLPLTDDWALLADGTIAIVRGKDYRVELIRPDGQRVAPTRIPFEWRRVSDSERTTIVDSMRKFVQISDSSAKEAGRLPPYLSSEVLPADSLPEYYPPLRARGVQADADGNLWILPATAKQSEAGLVYDVISNNGTLRERVQLPAGCALAGFARNAVVYLNCQAAGEFRLKRTRVIR